MNLFNYCALCISCILKSKNCMLDKQLLIFRTNTKGTNNLTEWKLSISKKSNCSEQPPQYCVFPRCGVSAKWLNIKICSPLTVTKKDIKNERIKFVGKDAVKIDKGTWRSLDGKRQFRTVPNDYLGKHGIGNPLVPNTPHVHFEFLSPPNPGGKNLKVIKNVHVPIN